MASHKRLSAAETLYCWAIEILISQHQADLRSRPLAGLSLCLLAWREHIDYSRGRFGEGSSYAELIVRQVKQMEDENTLRRYEHSQPGSRSEIPEAGKNTPRRGWQLLRTEEDAMIEQIRLLQLILSDWIVRDTARSRLVKTGFLVRHGSDYHHRPTGRSS